MTIMSSIILLAYFGLRFHVFTSQTNPQITQALAQEFYDSKFQHTFEDLDFRIAWAVEDTETFESKDNPLYVMFRPIVRY